MNQLTNFPVKHIEKSLVFNRDGTVWAWFFIEGFGYDHRDDFQKDIPFNAQMTFLVKNSYDIHQLSIPFRTDTGTIIDKSIAALKRKKPYALQENGLDYLEQLKEESARPEFNKNSNQYQSYIGVQLDPRKNRYKRGNTGTNLVAGLKDFVNGMNSTIRQSVGLDPYDIPKVEIEAYHQQAEALEKELGAAYSSAARLLSTGETLFLCEYSFNLSDEKKKVSTLELAETVQGYSRDGKPMEAIRPNKDAYYEMQDAIFEPVDGRTLLMRKILDDTEREEYVRYLVVDDMEPINHHPGFEWVYRLQTEMNFPIGLSIRAYHRPNQHIRKELSNSLLQFKDQKREAEAVNAQPDALIVESEDGAKDMETLFQKTGSPAYNCSFVIRVTAPDRQTLSIRIRTIRDQLDKDNISAISPYGEAFNNMAEFFPGSPRLSNDYFHTVAPGVIAGMMFGATTNIGDGRGYPIGFTNKFKKFVYIQPDLAAKDFENVKNVTSSLSVMVTGETGNGKSVFMNLYAILSAITQGSQVLIIDPKGDRKGWAKGLPFVPKEQIGIWTLGQDKKDAGSLDPFRTSVTVEEGAAVWLDIASYIVNIGLDDPKYSMLSEAVEVASQHKEPCGEVIVQQLEYMLNQEDAPMSAKRRESLEELVHSLYTIRRDQLSSLLFGRVGQEYNTLSMDKQLQIIMVENLQLPSGDDWKDTQPRPSVRISEGILLSITAFTKQFVHQTPQEVHKIVLQDEAKTLSRSKMGREQIEWLKTNGRYFNVSSMVGTQNASDHANGNNIGMKFTFKLSQREEAVRMLGFYNLPQTEENIKTLQELEQGECLFQDIYGRTAVIHVNTIFKDLLDAFRTNPATDEEIEAERQNHILGV